MNHETALDAALTWAEAESTRNGNAGYTVHLDIARDRVLTGKVLDRAPGWVRLYVERTGDVIFDGELFVDAAHVRAVQIEW